MENWKLIDSFPKYEVSDHGQIRMIKNERVIAQYENQSGTVCCGMMRDGKQYHRSVPLLVARAFVKPAWNLFDTPINLDGDRWNNHINNLVWRPRWFAVKYNRQFLTPYSTPILFPIKDMDTGDIYRDSIDCCKINGLLEEDLVLSIFNRTTTWPTQQRFSIVLIES